MYLIKKIRELLGQHLPSPTNKFQTFVFEGDCMGEFYAYCALTVSIDGEVPDPDKVKELKSRVIIWNKKPLEYHKGKRLPIFTEEIPEKGMFNDIKDHYLIP